MATNGHIKSVHQIKDGEIYASLGYGKSLFNYLLNILFFDVY